MPPRGSGASSEGRRRQDEEEKSGVGRSTREARQQQQHQDGKKRSRAETGDDAHAGSTPASGGHQLTQDSPQGEPALKRARTSDNPPSGAEPVVPGGQSPSPTAAPATSAAASPKVSAAAALLAKIRAQKARVQADLELKRAEQNQGAATATGAAAGGTDGNDDRAAKAARLKELQARIAAKMTKLNAQVSPSVAPSPPTSADVGPVKTEEGDTDASKFVDPGIRGGRLAGPSRRGGGLQFHDPGYFARREERKRLVQRRKAEAETSSKKRSAADSIPTHVRFIAQRPGLEVKLPARGGDVETPLRHEAEWWDRWLLPNADYNDVPSIGNGTENSAAWDELCAPITNLVEHPPLESLQVPVKVTTIHLTEKERKKMRRNDRLERRRQAQERVLMGLEEAPKPKVKLSNMMRVLGAEAAADPTAIERQVVKEMAARRATHDESNASRKLTRQERAAKVRDKLVVDKEQQRVTSVYVVKDLVLNGRVRFKIEATARKLLMTGCVLVVSDDTLMGRCRELLPPAVRESFARVRADFVEEQRTTAAAAPAAGDEDEVPSQRRRRMLDSIMGGLGSHFGFILVEGGKKSANKFDKLMARRLPLRSEDALELNADEFSPAVLSQRHNTTALVWRGAVHQTQFSLLRTEVISTEGSVRQLLATHYSEQFWDMAVERLLNLYRDLALDLGGSIAAPSARLPQNPEVRRPDKTEGGETSVVGTIAAAASTAGATDAVAQDVASYLDALDDL